MRITDALYGEHGSLYTLMNAIEGRLAGAELAELQTSAALFEAAIVAHAHFENDPFFAALDRVMPGGGPPERRLGRDVRVALPAPLAGRSVR